MPHTHLMQQPRPRKLAAWLGIFAIWLTLVMPWVAQWRADAARMAPVICHAGEAPSSEDGNAPPHGPERTACGYCSLLTHTPFVGASPPPLPAALAPSAAMPPIASAWAGHPARYLRAQPRAPPLAA